MRNHPENYLAVLKQHFSEVPAIISAESQVAPLTKDINLEDSYPNTTNQNGKFTAFQRWFAFKEAFSPSFVMGAIECLGYKPKHIIDPFGGSGTTALTAQLLDINATTIEINPFTADLILAKATPLSLDIIKKVSIEFFEKLEHASINKLLLSHLPPTFIEDDKKERWIFPKDVAFRISQYLGVINSYSNLDIRRLLKITLGAVLIPASNVYINGKGRRYRKNWKSNQPTIQILDSLFRKQFDIVIEDSLRFQHRPASQINVHNADSRITLANLQQTADLIVFSPPYPNSFDYTDIYNVELWVLGYLVKSEDNTALRKQTLISHVQAKRAYEWPKYESKTLTKVYEDLVKVRTNLWNVNIPEMVTAYFKDLEEILIHSYRLLEKHGKVIMVVGDSKYSNVLIQVADILSELADEIGFTSITKTEVRKMRASAQQGGGQQLGEWIIELSNNMPNE